MDKFFGFAKQLVDNRISKLFIQSGFPISGFYSDYKYSPYNLEYETVVITTKKE